MNTITEEQFWETYRPIKNALVAEADELAWDGCLFETYGPEWDYVQETHQRRPQRVWTLLEVADGLCIQSGLHHVNRVGYFLTEVPWTEATETDRLEG